MRRVSLIQQLDDECFRRQPTPVEDFASLHLASSRPCNGFDILRRIINWWIYYCFFILGNHNPEGGLKIRGKNYKMLGTGMSSNHSAVTIRQTVMQKNRVKALYQD